jgi:group I intron endonuclease
MDCIVYKHTNKINGKIYVGQTWRTIRQRSKNGTHYKGNPHFWAAIQKYGWKNFQSELITVAHTQEIANYWEQYFIDQYDSRNRDTGYNFRDAGSHGKMSTESRLKMSEARMGKEPWNKGKLGCYSGAVLEQMSKSRKGKTSCMKGKAHTKQARQQMSISRMGYQNHLGKSHTNEAKQKMSVAFRGKTWKLIDGKRVWQ